MITVPNTMPKAPKIPDPPAPLPMPPTADDPAMLAEKRRKLERRMASTGSVSTMLTNDQAYSGSTLGLR
jgi:hypothetical protein